MMGPPMPMKKLLAIWHAEAHRDFDQALNRVQSAFSLANRLDSGAHASALLKEAEASAMSILAKARELEVDPRYYVAALEEALSCFSELVQRLRSLPSAPRLQGNSEMIVVFSREEPRARERIESEVEKWRLENTLRRRRGVYDHDKSELPSDEAIVRKMQELQDRGYKRDEAAKLIRSEPGFESVGNAAARAAVSGRLGRGRRPKAEK